MQTNSRIAQAFQKAASAGRAALIPFIVAGDPDIATTRKILKELVAAGADMIELGIPYSDPLADGPSIVAAAQRALEHNVGIADVLSLIADVPVPVVTFTYANPIIQFGIDTLGKALRDAGAAGVIIPDLPLEETLPIARILATYAIEVPLLIAPTTKSQRAKEIAEASRGFIYLVSRLGVTGATQSQAPDAAAMRAHVAELRTFTQLPIAVGFGLSQRTQIHAVSEFADGAIVGSALVDAIHAAGPAQAPQAAHAFLAELAAGSIRHTSA